MLVFVTSKHNGAAHFGGQGKTKRLYQLCVCVMWKRQCVPNTIPFSKGKTSISHTHTRCFAYFSKLRHTHTLGFSSPRRCTHPRSCKLQDSKQIFPLPKMAVDCWPLLIWTWGESGCCCSSSLTPCILPDVRNGGSSKNLSEEAYGDPLHMAHKGSLVFGHTLNTFTCLDRSFFEGEEGYDLWPSQKYYGKIKFFGHGIQNTTVLPWYHVQKHVNTIVLAH